MKVYIEKLRNGGNHWEYNQMVEKYLQLTIAKQLNISHGDMTEGYDPEYDFILGNRKVEQKISAKSNIQVEYAKYDNTPSGVSLTKSDLHLYISPGFCSKKGEVGKVRLLRTNDLRKSIHNSELYEGSCISGCNKKHKVYHKSYKPSEYGPGSRIVEINPHMLFDLKIADVPIIRNSSEWIIGYDLGRMLFDEHSYVKNTLHYWFYEKMEEK